MWRIQHAAYPRLHGKAAEMNPLEDEVVPLVFSPPAIRRIQAYLSYPVCKDGVRQPFMQVQQVAQQMRRVIDIVVNGHDDVFGKVL